MAAREETSANTDGFRLISAPGRPGRRNLDRAGFPSLAPGRKPFLAAFPYPLVNGESTYWVNMRSADGRPAHLPPPIRTTTAVLVRRVEAGDREAFVALTRLYQKKVFVLAYSFVRDKEDALDLVQETFLRLYQKIGTYRPGRPFEAWLLQIARNLCIDHYRKQTVKRREHESGRTVEEHRPPGRGRGGGRAGARPQGHPGPVRRPAGRAAADDLHPAPLQAAQERGDRREPWTSRSGRSNRSISRPSAIFGP